MTNVTADFAISVDGFTAGINQRLDEPFGDAADGRSARVPLTRWMIEEREANDAAIKGILTAKAYIMGRNMFSPGRGAWDLDWRGWWGEEPPYHGPVFVLTHTPREPLPMEGGTTFHFVTDGIESALEQARAAAGEKGVSLAGGASVAQQYLAAGLLDEIVVSIVPNVLGGGARLFENLGDARLEQVESVAAPGVTHIRYARV